MEWIRQIASPARLEVLRILYEAKAPIRLRTLAELCQVTLRPVQLAVQNLERAGFISITRKGNAVAYEIQKLPFPLECFFAEVSKINLQTTAKSVAKYSRSLGPFQEDAFKILMRKGRS